MSPIDVFGEPQRLVIAVAATATYVLLCAVIVWRQRIKRRNTARLFTAAVTGAAPHWCVAYASQTGSAEELAMQTARTLHLSGIAVQVCELSTLDAASLARAERVLFVVSTYGEGNAPDNAAAFAQRVMGGAQRVMGAPLPLGHLHYAVLALGDSSYANFCGFGRELDRWLRAQGAQPLFPAVEADQCAADAIDAWRRQLSHLVGTDDAPDWQGPSYDRWQLSARQQLNRGSQGNAIFHLEFEPVAGAALPAWESGDLAQVLVPTDADHPREYSIASIPSDGRLHLLVRLHRHPDGSFGAASDWLTQQMHIGDSVPLRLRRHARFRLGANAERPLILIGNGSGIAGLRGHLKTRAAGGAGPNWLIFGERNANCDYHYREEIGTWQRAGLLARLDTVFSRDQPERRYVQDCLLEAGVSVREWIDKGAAIYVCGSLKGMAAGVDEALTEVLGRERLEDLSLSGRYRRDVY